MGGGSVKVVGSKDEWNTILSESKSKPVLVDFSATWCGPCRLISPVFAELSNKYTEIVFLNIDVDDVPEVAEQCSIKAMPTFQVWVEGKKVDELVGASREKLEALVAKYAK